jgi:hypothetical protein
MLMSLCSMFVLPNNVISFQPIQVSNHPVEAFNIDIPFENGSVANKPISKDDIQDIIQEYCRNENQWQEQLCYETHMAMLENGSLKMPSDKSATNISLFSPIPTQLEPDEMPLKEWARLLPVQ